jgi:hypothetical protein
VTVVIGVVTVTVVPVGTVTVTAVIGVLTVTGDVGTGTVGTETVGTPIVEGSSDDAAAVVDEPMAVGVAASPLKPCVTALISEPPAVVK